MSLIVAARFSTFEEAARAARQLMRVDIPGDAIHTFYMNTSTSGAVPAGDGQSVEPDRHSSELGALIGAALLGLILAVLCGAIAATFNGPAYIVLLGAGVGGYIGALLGALWLAGKWRMVASERGTDSHLHIRATGVMLAVQVPEGKDEVVSEALRLSGGKDLERAQGDWSSGEWKDLGTAKPTPPIHETSRP